MSCENVQEWISSRVDKVPGGEEEKLVSAHLESCRTCSAHLKAMEALRANLRSLPQPPVPELLAIQLRVLASRERVRQLARSSFSARVRYWADRAQFAFDNLMRPVALPVAGGLLFALLLFGMLVPRLSFVYNVGGDTPLSIASDPDGKVVDLDGIRAQHLYDSFRDLPRLEPVSADTSGDETVVELTIDNRGLVADYSVRQGELTPDISNIIMFSKFTPAMFFYQPAWGKLLVTVRRRHSARG